MVQEGSEVHRLLISVLWLLSVLESLSLAEENGGSPFLQLITELGTSKEV